MLSQEVRLLDKLTEMFGEQDLPQITFRKDPDVEGYVLKAEIHSRFLKQWFIAIAKVKKDFNDQEWEDAFKYLETQLEEHVPKISFKEHKAR